MEWLDGEDLGARLARGPLSVTDSAVVCARVAKALSAVHAQGIVHRDVKPSNLFIPDGLIDDIKLLDFGVARIAELGSMTQSGARIGTVLYMAPEQARGARDLDARVDIFALGCVIHECLTGRKLFSGGDLMSVLIGDSPRGCSTSACAATRRSGRPRGLIARMLAKRPCERPRDAAEVAAEITDLLHCLPVAMTASPLLAPPPLTGGEQRVVSVIVIGSPRHHAGAIGPTLVNEMVAVDWSALAALVTAHGGALEVLADGAAVVTFS
jgi:eukaryotic-like serine/threonine-protein kinase